MHNLILALLLGLNIWTLALLWCLKSAVETTIKASHEPLERAAALLDAVQSTRQVAHTDALIKTWESAMAACPAGSPRREAYRKALADAKNGDRHKS